LTIELGNSIREPKACEWLKSFRGSGKSARLAAAMLSAKVKQEHYCDEPAIFALKNRVARIAGWIKRKYGRHENRSKNLTNASYETRSYWVRPIIT